MTSIGYPNGGCAQRIRAVGNDYRSSWVFDRKRGSMKHQLEKYELRKFILLVRHMCICTTYLERPVGD